MRELDITDTIRGYVSLGGAEWAATWNRATNTPEYIAAQLAFEAKRLGQRLAN